MSRNPDGPDTLGASGVLGLLSRHQLSGELGVSSA